MRPGFLSRPISSNTLLIGTCFLLLIGCNATFFGNVLKTYPLSNQNAASLISLAAAFFAFNLILLGLFAFGRMTRPVLSATLLLSALAAYFMDSYGIVINSEMLQNVGQTNLNEAGDLLTPKLLAYFFLLGLLPSFLIARVPLLWRGWRIELIARAKLLFLALSVIALAAVLFGGFYASFIRTHKSLRNHANPAYFIFAAAKMVSGGQSSSGNAAPGIVAPDAHIPASDTDRELFILVVGETARADRFSLNGYPRDTMPELKKANAISFGNFWSCGTSTAVSVPCMFSPSGMARFDQKETARQENLLDILQRVGVNVLWLDNNSDSKGVALRVPYQNYRTPALNTICDSECRDEGMLVSLQDYINAHPKGDIFIVLHQMGNHGPAYFKRYPPEFEKFRPACQNNDLSQCSKEEIDNAYDNAILYTDHFLGKAIELLKRNDKTFETALFYLSDHGESLGEGGIYLHGMPRSIAPDSQQHVPGILWLGNGFDEIDLPALNKKRHQRFSHDNLFHTVLGFLEIRTSAYQAELDILDGCRKPE